jgi:hypothetical protein
VTNNELLGGPENTVNSLDVLSDAVDHKFKAHPEEVSTYCAVTGQIFETLELGTAYLRREMLPDGSRGAPDIDYQRKSLSGKISWNERITLNENDVWVYVFDDEGFGEHQAGDRVRAFKKGIIIARVLAGRPKLPDRWADDPNIEQDLNKL